MLMTKFKQISRQFNSLTQQKPRVFDLNSNKLSYSLREYPISPYNCAPKSYFAQKKQAIPQKKSELVQKTVNNGIQQSEFLWKLNIFFNVAGIGAGFFFPCQALMFVLTSNSMIQIYEAGRYINRIKQLAQKSSNFSPQQNEDSLQQIKDILKKSTFKLNQVLINKGALFISTILMTLGVLYPSFGEYALMGLNFWILFNLKFNKFAQGYYLALASLVVFQFFYFQNLFKSLTKQEIQPLSI